jgi:hypothetical protein
MASWTDIFVYSDLTNFISTFPNIELPSIVTSYIFSGLVRSCRVTNLAVLFMNGELLYISYKIKYVTCVSRTAMQDMKDTNKKSEANAHHYILYLIISSSPTRIFHATPCTRTSLYLGMGFLDDFF